MAYLTNFPIPNQAKSYLVPVFGSDTHKSIFVKPNSGNDANDGLSPDSAVNTLTRALAIATANQNDVVYLISESNTASSTSDALSATLDWSKDLVHLVGVTAPSKFAQRARISQATAADAISPLFKVSGDSCVISNIHLFHGSTSASSKVCVEVTGTRNVFENVHFGGMGDLSKTQSVADAASLFINGGSENYFVGCTIGLDSATRDGDPSEILFDGGASRNYFEDCYINSFIDATGFASVKVADSTGIDRYQIFKNCVFATKSANKATAQTSVFSIPAISQGGFLLWNTYAVTDGGAAEWDNNNRGIIWTNNVAAAASAAGGVMTNQ